MRAGELRHAVKVQRPHVTRDSYGAEVVSWVELGTFWCSAVPVSGREYFSASQVNSETTVRFRLRNLAGLTTGDRIQWAGKPHDVQAVLDVGGNGRELELVAIEVPL
jgi:SPP1 family predicted phage head-tail adaptor